MGTPAAVVGANLVVGYLEVKLFRLLPQIYPRDFVDFIIRSFFRFLDDLIHEWLKDLDMQPLYHLLNSLDPDIKYVLDNFMLYFSNYLDLKIKTVGDRLVFDIYVKLTNSFNYLKYTSCHPKHTKNNIALSLGRRIIKLCSAQHHEKNIKDLRSHLVRCDFPDNVIDDALEKLYSPPTKASDIEHLTFVRTFNPKISPDLHLIDKCLDHLQSPDMKSAFSNKKPLCATRQPKNLRKMLVQARFSMAPSPPRPIPIVGLQPCGNCKFCRLGYIIPATEIVLRRGNKTYRWTYRRLFTCNSINILYVLVCIRCDDYYVGKASETKQRISKHASDVRLPENSKCKKCTNHLRSCSGLVEPYFRFYPFYYAEEPGFRHFLETRFQLRWRPPLNSF